VVVDDHFQFSVTVRYGNRSLEWRAPVGIDNNEIPHLTNTHSDWELALIQLLLDQFEEWFRKHTT
jgi:hypothetical protein